MDIIMLRLKIMYDYLKNNLIKYIFIYNYNLRFFFHFFFFSKIDRDFPLHPVVRIRVALCINTSVDVTADFFND